MRHLVLSLFAVLLLCPASGFAGELNDVTMTDSINLGGESMRLQGMGLRTKYRFKVYVAGLYMESPTGDAGGVVRSGDAKVIRMSMKRSLDTEKIGGSIEDGFKQNSGSEMGALQARLDTLRGMLPSVKEGDLVTIGWIPARGTVVWFNGTEKGVIPGRDFADALFKVWFGDDPVQTSLMEGMLGE